jgi:tetratricopeptide (TPR) repeat protein
MSASPHSTRVRELVAQAYRWRHDDSRRALGFARQALALAETTGDAPGRAWALLRLAVCELILAEPGAEAHGAEATEGLAALGERAGEAEGLNLLANIRSAQGDYAAAIVLHERCFALREACGDIEGAAGSLNNLGAELREIGRHAEAQLVLRESLALAQTIADLRGVAYARVNLGLCGLEQRDADAAVDHFEQAFASVTRTEDRALECSVLTGLGRARTLQGRHDEARGLLQHAQSLARRTGNLGDQARVRIALAALEEALGRLDAAEALLLAALPALQRSGERPLEAQVRQRLAALRIVA